MTLCDVWKFFLLYFYEGGDVDSVVVKCERYEHRDDTSIVDGDQEGVKCELSSLLKDQVKEMSCPHWVGDGTIGCSSCVWGVRILLKYWRDCDSPMFLLSDGSLIWMWSASFAQQGRCCSVCHVKSFLSSAFGCFVAMWWFLIAQVVWFLWSETLSFRGFHICIQLCSCGIGISSDRLC